MNLNEPSPDLLQRLARRLGPKGFTTDPGDMEPWLTDWRGRVRGAAAALLSPATREEVADVVAMAAAERVAIVPQGGNTSMVAGATPNAGALLLSLRRMNAIRTVSAEDNIAIVEAGVILSDLHRAAEAAGRRFPLSLAAKDSATIGGLVSTNAGGTQVLRFGPMRSLLLGIEAVLPDGSIFEGLSALRKDNRGYDLRQLLAGAEGTLGVVTAAALRLEPVIGQRVVVWAGLANPDDALHLLRALEHRLGDAIEAFELVPSAALELVLANIERMRDPLSAGHGCYALIEAAFPESAPDPLEAVETALAEAMEAGLVEDASIAASEAQAEALWALRENISEAERLDGISVKHDISVPVSAMPGFMRSAAREVEGAFAGARVLAFGHLGDGNIHFNVRSPEGAEARPWFDANNAAVSRMVHDLVTAAGGSISAEHGIGQFKLAEFARLAGPARLGALRAIKQALDPLGIMNPGKLVPLASEPPAP
jgi:FAD/FMN-containing dehydrogenase